jgi:hypothetical protein
MSHPAGSDRCRDWGEIDELLCPADILHGTVDLGGTGPQQAGLPSVQTDVSSYERSSR